mgnify:CR=1 FL=1
MKFVALWSLKEGVDQTKMAEVMARRADLKYPAGVKLIAEYWSPKDSPAVVNILEADNAAALLVNSVIWIDVLELDIFPVVTWEEGLEFITDHLGGE